MSPVALITGGASGIGLGLTTSLLSRSYNVLIADINPTTGAAVVERLKEEFPEREVVFVLTDVKRFESLEKAFRAAREKWGRVEVVGAIAGISQVFTSPDGKDPFLGGARMREDGSVEPPDLRLMEINLLGVMNTVHLALAYFRANEPDANGFRGRIVAAASTAGIYPFPHESLYGSSKHGVVGLVRALATSLKPEGITINALAPSLVETNIGNKEAFDALRAEGLITPMSTIVRAFTLLTSPDCRLSGQVLECCLEQVAFRKPPSLMNENERRSMDMIWPGESIVEVLKVELPEGKGWSVVEG